MFRVVFIFVICAFFLHPFPIEAVSQERVRTYNVSTDIFPNPDRGFYRSRGTGEEPGPITPYRPLVLSDLISLRTRITLVYRYFGLKEWRTTDIPADVLVKMQSDFDVLRRSGMKAIIRFAYSNTIGEPDATLPIILRHLDQLRPILRANKDVISVMQAGFIGAWGEWHSSMNGHDNSERRKIILTKILQVLPKDKMVQVRIPHHKQEMFGLPNGIAGALTSSNAFNQSYLSRVGHHNDCFLGDGTDYGTYWHNGFADTAAAKAYLRLDNRYVPMGGETCAPSPFSLCPNALGELARLRWSYLNESYHPDVLHQFATDGCIDEMNRRLGYRFSLTSTSYTPAVRPGGSLTFRMSIRNFGWASPFNSREVELLLRSNVNGEIFIVRLPLDPRFWLGGETVTSEFSIGVPSDLSAGNYTLLLNLPDAELDLHGRAEYSIRLANQDTWESATGYNNLLDSIRVDPTLPGSPYSGNLRFRPMREIYPTDGSTNRYKLFQNFPNPFNSMTTLEFLIPKTSSVSLKLYNVLGEEVDTLVDGEVEGSAYPLNIQIDGSKLSSGLYICRLIARPLTDEPVATHVFARKILLVK